MGPKQTKPFLVRGQTVTSHTNAGVLLVWLHYKTLLFSPLSRNILREICEYLASLSLVWVSEDKLSYLNIQALQWESSIYLAEALPIASASWVLLDEGRLMVCGGEEEDGGLALKNAYEIRCNGTIRRIHDMIFGRTYCGMVIWKKTVHVFGSFQSPEEGSTCECLNLPLTESSEWTHIGDMSKPRSMFTPVVWRNAVFLCGGFPLNNTVEVFDGHFMQLLELNEGGNAVSCVSGDTLLILTGNYLSVISAIGDKYAVESRKHLPCSVCPRAGAKLVQDTIFSLYSNQIVRHSAADGQRLTS